MSLFLRAGTASMRARALAGSRGRAGSRGSRVAVVETERACTRATLVTLAALAAERGVPRPGARSDSLLAIHWRARPSQRARAAWRIRAFDGRRGQSSAQGAYGSAFATPPRNSSRRPKIRLQTKAPFGSTPAHPLVAGVELLEPACSPPAGRFVLLFLFLKTPLPAGDTSESLYTSRTDQVDHR